MSRQSAIAGFRLLAALLTAALAPNAALAEPTVFLNARVLTMDADDAVAEAFAVEGGRFTVVGTEKQVRRKMLAYARVVDLKGRTVVPGFIENHIHMIRAAATWKDELRLDAVESREQALTMLADHASRLAPDAWVYTLGGFTPAQFKDDKSAFTALELQVAAGGRPVYLQVGFQGAFLNKTALLRAGMAAPEQEVLFASAATMQTVQAMLFNSLSKANEEGALKLMRQLASAGVTTVLDVGGFGIRDEHYNTFQDLAARNALPVRVRYTRWFTNMARDSARGEDAFKRELEVYRPGVGNYFYKLFGAGELLFLPMQDGVGNPGSTETASLRKMESIYEALAAKRWPMKIHAEDPATIDRHLDAIERVNAKHPVTALNWGFEHVDGITPGLLSRMRALNMTAGLHSRPLLASKWGAAVRASPYPPLRWVHESGVRYGLGSDAMMVNGFNPMLTIAWAVTGRSLDGSVVTQQRLSRMEALRAHTINNATLLGEEKELGSIEVSKWADFVVLDKDVLRVSDEELRNVRPIATYVAGVPFKPHRRSAR